jgi:alpha-L-arabinofuranosidase
MIGVGTWNTQAEYKDIKVTAPDGRVLFTSDFSHGTDGWKTTGGDWDVVNGALRQSGDGTDIRAVAGDPAWTNYTLTLRARKLGGEEGFLILFQTADVNNPRWWNIGGWRNTASALQGGGLDERQVRGGVETNRWYDIRVELAPNSVKAFLDDKLVNEDESKPVATLYCAAGRDERSKEYVLQVVNAADAAQETDVTLAGVEKIAGPASGMVLTSANPADENSLENPGKVAPQKISFTPDGPEFHHSFPANSLTVLRLKTE